ncbi:MAG: folate-binding protein YgfZ [OCS116 cluster bacterium]|uniref:CAF17 C-terminal domain-containing protein n=1 Tax=OCS116 cluster bacterium TaxID=2030921 RepID=A0A2A4Z8L1_9PROT|nr:folate-binding protein YgfZ [OCS116 cluster bacterium]
MMKTNLAQPICSTDRSFIHVTGTDAAEFLQGQISNDVDLLNSQAAIHALILTPQGKILADLFVYNHQNGYLLDVHASIQDWLIARFNMFKLRSNVNFVDLSNALQLVISPDAYTGALISAPDPRIPAMQRHILAGKAVVSSGKDTDFHHYMAANAIIEFGTDYQASEHFPQDLWFDKLGSISFTKGCYVGQEVVSRMRHKSAARKRLLPLISDAQHQKGDKVLLNQKSVGEVICQIGNISLAMMRIDKLPESIVKLDDFEIKRPEWTQN